MRLLVELSLGRRRYGLRRASVTESRVGNDEAVAPPIMQRYAGSSTNGFGEVPLVYQGGEVGRQADRVVGCHCSEVDRLCDLTFEAKDLSFQRGKPGRVLR